MTGALVRRPIVMVCAATAVFLATFLFRFLSLEFMNDHFAHLSASRQILLGDVPVRDFFDSGSFLQYYASAAALTLSGGTLFGETILTVSLIALGTALTFFLAATLSASLPIGLLAAVAAASIGPRLYGYPKVFLYVLAMACAWRYVQRRSTARLLVVAVVTAMAFLFRHDHGVYIGFTMAGFIALLDWGERRRALLTLTRYVSFTALLLLPFGIFIQSTTGVVAYLQSSAPHVTEVATPRFVWPQFAIDRSEPVNALSRPPERRFHVRWADEVDDAVRGEREAHHGLTRADRGDDAHTWSYVLADEATDKVRALLADPLVADTNGVDRNTSRLPSETWSEMVVRRLLWFRRAVLTDGNAVAWLYYLSLLLPIAGAAMLVVGWKDGRITREDVAIVGALVLLCTVVEVTLVRGAPAVRLPDVAAPMAVLGAWLTGRWLKNSPAHGPVSKGRFAAAAVGGLVTLWSCAILGNVGVFRETTTLLANPGSTLARIGATSRALRLRPIDGWAPPGSTGERALARYILDCTAPTDRLLSGNFLPELSFYSERGFAGGQVYLLTEWHSSTTDQQLTVARLQRQRVPLVILDEPSHDVTWRYFPLVADHVRQHYDVVATSAFAGERSYVVYVDRRLSPTGTYEPLGLPCYS